MYSVITNKTSVELTLNPNDNYVIQIKTLSEGGLGEGSEPIHIHQLSKSLISCCRLLFHLPLALMSS